MLYFPQNWDQYQRLPVGRNAIERLLTDPNQRQMPGPLLRAIQDRCQQVTVLAGIHQGGAPGAAAQDPRPHITLSFNRHVYHVQLTSNGGVFNVTY